MDTGNKEIIEMVEPAVFLPIAGSLLFSGDYDNYLTINCAIL